MDAHPRRALVFTARVGLLHRSTSLYSFFSPRTPLKSDPSRPVILSEAQRTRRIRGCAPSFIPPVALQSTAPTPADRTNAHSNPDCKTHIPKAPKRISPGNSAPFRVSPTIHRRLASSQAHPPFAQPILPGKSRSHPARAERPEVQTRAALLHRHGPGHSVLPGPSAAKAMQDAS